MNDDESDNSYWLDYNAELDESDNSQLPVGYGDSWDGSSTNQTNYFFIGQSGYVTILWHVVNNPMEKYDPSKSYQMSALDGSALYVWCSLHFTYPDAHASIVQANELLYKSNDLAPTSQTHHL